MRRTSSEAVVLRWSTARPYLHPMQEDPAVSHVRGAGSSSEEAIDATSCCSWGPTTALEVASRGIVESL